MSDHETQMAKRFAQALVRDVQDNPRLNAALDHLVHNLPASEAGLWIASIKRDLAREARGDFSEVIFPNVRALYRQAIQEEEGLRSGMGFIGSLLTVAVPALVSAGTAVYTTKLQVKANEDIAEMQQKQALAEAEAVKADAAARMKEAEAAMKQAETASVADTVMAGPDLPPWLLPVGIGAAVLVVGYFVLRKKR